MADSEFVVTIRRWKHGWELHLKEHGVTQVRRLANARAQAKDYLDSIDPDTDHSGATVILAPDADSEQVKNAQHARADADQAILRADNQLRDAIDELHNHHGHSTSEIAALLGITRIRVFRLMHDSKRGKCASRRSAK